MMKKIALSMASGAGMALFVTTPAHASFDDQFRCEGVGDGEHLVVVSSKDSNRASVHFSSGIDSIPPVLPEITELNAVYNYPESGARYEGGEYIFLTTSKTAILIYGAGTPNPGHVECSFAGEDTADTADAADGAITLNLPARSWGGKLRRGPDMSYDQIGSLGEGERVTLLENTGIMMNGYAWFRIRTASGQEGFKWGGILCANSLPVAGLFEDCMPE